MLEAVKPDEVSSTVGTAQYFGSLCYGMPVWYTAYQKKFKPKLDVLNYELLRVVDNDWHRPYPKEILDTLGRALPSQFGYLIAMRIGITSLVYRLKGY